MAIPEVDVVEAPTAEQLRELADHMRAEDLAEVLASGYGSALEALEASIADSAAVRAFLFDGKVAAVFGLVDLGGRRACAWMLTSNVVDRHRLTFMRTSKYFLLGMIQNFSAIVSFVDARYERALAWLECLGFEIQPAQPHPVSGLPFHVVVIGGE